MHKVRTDMCSMNRTMRMGMVRKGVSLLSGMMGVLMRVLFDLSVASSAVKKTEAGMCGGEGGAITNSHD